MKTKIAVEQVAAGSDEYRVMQLVNRVKPQVGSVMTAGEIEAIRMEDEEVTIVVKKAR